MLAHLTDTLTTLITNLYVSTGLLGIVLAMAIESCCIPLPSEIVMPLAGIMIVNGKILQGTNFYLSLILVALAGSLGCLIGSTVAYAIGRSGGRPLMLKYGRYVLISQHDADKADEFFKKWGSATAFFSRLLPVVRTYISLPAGIAKMPFAKFALYTFLGSFPWCLVLAYVGTILGKNLDKLSPIFHSLDVVILVVVVLLIVLYVWRHLRNDRKARAAAAGEGMAPQASTPPSTATANWQSDMSASQPSWRQYPPQQQSAPQPTSYPPFAQPSQPGWGPQAVSPGQQSRADQPSQFKQPPTWGQQPPQQG